MRPIRIAQIGTSRNSHGCEIFTALKQLNDIFEIVGYAFPEGEREKFPERMGAFQGYTELTVDQILSDPTVEAVTVECEEVYLTKYALMAAKAGKHIHMEKPGGIELPAFEELIATVQKNQTVFHPGYMYRYNPCVIQLLQEVKNGEFGDIIRVEAEMNCLHTDSVREWLSVFPGGMMFFLGCHLIDLILQIQGMPKHIIPMNRASGKNGITSEDCGMALLEYEYGISLAKAIGVEYGGYAKRRLVITGTKKTAVLEPLEMREADSMMFTERVDYTNASWIDRGIKTRSAEYDRYRNMMASFGRMVCGEIANPHSYEYELKLYKTVLACCGIL